MHRRFSFIACSLALFGGCSAPSPQNTPDAAGPGRDAAGPVDAPIDPSADAPPLVTFDLRFVDPDHGPFHGNTEVLVRGIGFDENTQVRFGGRVVEPLDFQLIDSRRILVRTPPGEPGSADIEVEKNGELASLPGGYQYEAIAIDPPYGSVAGGTFVTITGFGTDFGPGTSVSFDGIELGSVQILGDQVLTGYTPPGTAGSADVRVTTAMGVFEAGRAFTYQSTGDPFFGGMSGGPIQGTVNVVVIDSITDNGVPGAYVVIGDPATSPYQGLTDSLGQITFSDPSLAGPITVSAAAEGYELGSFVGYDAENLSIFLRRPPDPFNGPPPPAPQIGRIYGHVLFGDAVSVGSPYWDLVPEPRTPTERKRLYVTTTASNIFGRPIGPTRFIDYEGYNPDVVAWEFEVLVRPSATAVVAVAGLYDPELDPSGVGATGFQPFAMGVTRGILVGPGEQVVGVDIVVDTPLDSALQVELDSPPALDNPSFDGPTYYRIRPLVDLGGEGAILMNKHGMLTPPPPEPTPNYYRFAPGEDTIVLTDLAPLAGPVADASYGLLVGAYTETDTAPYSARVIRGIMDMSAPVIAGDFIGTPRPVDPLPFEEASRMGMTFEAEAPAAGEITFNMHMLLASDGAQLARIITRGDIFDVTIPDVTVAGLPPFPTGVDVNWYIWSIRVVGNTTFDQFTYRQLSSLYWDSYATSSAWVRFPTE